MQSTVVSSFRMFITDVVLGRRVGPKTVDTRFGEGRMLLAADALRIGMVDRIATFDATVAAALAAPTPAARARVELDRCRARAAQHRARMR